MLISLYAVPCEFGSCRNLYEEWNNYDPSAIPEITARHSLPWPPWALPLPVPATARRPTARPSLIANPQALSAPAGQGELWACKFSVDPVTKLPNGDVTSGRITASIVSGDGTLNTAVSGGNNTLIGYNTPAPTPQCVKIWTGGTSATVAVTEDPEPGSGLLFYRLVKRTPGAAFDDVYFTLDP